MKISEQFLQLYREYEVLVSEQKGIDTKDYENTLDNSDMNRLRMCRYFRNYLSHQNDGGFLEVSDAQIKFLQKVVNTLKIEGNSCKKAMKSVSAGACLVSETCEEALKKCGKLKTEDMLVISDTGFGITTVYDLINAGNAKLSDVKLKKNVYVAEPNEPIGKIGKDWVVVVTNDGTKTGKVQGVIYPSMR